ncbi:MAG: HAD family hydrolase [Clostridia bacterium]|nr:HAD family hydrolase [Clostridia bacterium]
MVKYTHIIWDWNGTLLNDISASLASVNDMLAMRGKPPIDVDFYRECIGVPIRKFYEKTFDMEKEDYSVLIEQYNEGYLRHLSSCRLTDGVVEVVDYFNKNGVKQAIISSSNNAQLIQNVTKYGIFDRFDAVLGAEDFLAGSKIERAENYLRHSGGESRVLVVGDIEHDAEMAHKLGADCVLLTSGHENRERLYAADAKVICDVRELITLAE